MKPKTNENKLHKSSQLFMQLGLIFSLAFSYFLLEYKTEVKSSNPLLQQTDPRPIENYFNVETIKIERKQLAVTKKIEPITPTTTIDEIIKQDDNTNEIEEQVLISPSDDNSTDETVHFADVEPEVEPLDNDDHLLTLVQEVPIYPGCEKMETRVAKMKCFESKVGKFIGRKFNTELASQLGLSSGKQKIYVKFLITSTGEIEIIGAKAAHSKLEKEGARVVNLLPKMKPGKQFGQPVNVSYLVPITFTVE